MSNKFGRDHARRNWQCIDRLGIHRAGGVAVCSVPINYMPLVAWSEGCHPPPLICFSMSAPMCTLLGIVLFSASLTRSAAGGLLLGMSFGLGAIVIPALAYGIGMAYLGTRLREQLQNWRPRIERISALLMVAVGINNLARW